MVEHATHNRLVTGSNPVGAKFIRIYSNILIANLMDSLHSSGIVVKLIAIIAQRNWQAINRIIGN